MSLPIVIDNGSYKCRAGFAGQETPQLVFRNHLAKLRKEKGKNKELEIQVGNEIEKNLDNVRFALKSQFDRNVVIHTDMQENVFDYLFTSLNIKSDERLEHPVVLTEAFLSPNYCRHLMSELLFECYQVPAISYGIDCLYSLAQNFPEAKNALILSLGYKIVEVIPFIDGNIDPSNSRRINLGGFEITYFLHKLLQLKYPAHGSTLTYSKIEEIVHNNCSIAEDYFEQLQKWTGIEYYNEHVLKLQGPKKHSANVSQSNLETIKERRKELSKKLTEINARKREERLAEDKERIVILNEIKESIEEDDSSAEAHRALEAAGVSTLHELLKQISILRGRINKSQEKSKSEITSESPTTSSKQKQINISPDITEVREKRTELLKKRFIRRQRRSEMANRRSLASQERMRVLSHLAKQEKNDTFGMNDDDWDVYKSIQKDGGGSDSNEEQDELNELEDVLRVHDPAFAVPDDEHELHVGLESIRAAELLFQPSMIGEPQAGIVETIDHVLKLYPGEIQNQLVSKVFVTGGPASFKGFFTRLKKDLMSIRPFESTFDIVFAQDSELDTWKGMSSWAAEPSNQIFFVSKAEYEEHGGEYLKQHSLSNIYFPSPNQQTFASME